MQLSIRLYIEGMIANLFWKVDTIKVFNKPIPTWLFQITFIILYVMY